MGVKSVCIYGVYQYLCQLYECVSFVYPYCIDQSSSQENATDVMVKHIYTGTIRELDNQSFSLALLLTISNACPTNKKRSLWLMQLWHAVAENKYEYKLINSWLYFMIIYNFLSPRTRQILLSWLL